jgi:SAM-dependent methyltransferase
MAFDRAAEIYDRTRAFPPGVGEKVVAALLPHLPRRGRVLEVGVGTGRIARLLLNDDVPVVGVDLSRPMMDRLLAEPPAGGVGLRLIQGDAQRLPLAAGAVTAAIAVHVFHLVGDAQRAMTEVLRVLGSGGMVAIGWNWHPPDSIGRRVRRAWGEIVAQHGAEMGAPGLREMEAPVTFFHARAQQHKEILACEWRVARSPRQALEDVEKKTFSSTWVVSEAVFPVCLAQLRAWAGREWADLDRPRDESRRFIWHVFSDWRA